MTHEFETLPDILGAIEDELRGRAAASVQPRRPAWRRPAAGLALAAACALGLVVVSPGPTGHESHIAYGQIALVQTRPEPVPDRLRDSPAVKEFGGPDATLTEAWTFDVLGGIGYVLRGPGLWCLVVPSPDAEAGADVVETCSPDLRYGLALSMGSTYVAAVPEGVRAPTIKHTDGTVTTLRPNAEGIVLSDALEAGAIITRYGTDGSVLESAPAMGAS